MESEAEARSWRDLGRAGAAGGRSTAPGRGISVILFEKTSSTDFGMGFQVRVRYGLLGAPPVICDLSGAAGENFAILMKIIRFSYEFL